MSIHATMLFYRFYIRINSVNAALRVRHHVVNIALILEGTTIDTDVYTDQNILGH